MMISLEKAQELKEAGLVWKPQQGDWRKIPNSSEKYLQIFKHTEHIDLEISVWLPSLSQLLAEIEARYPYLWQAGRVESGRYEMALMDCGYNVTSFEADTPEDACADALLWILKQEEAK